jgi:hypothetical protein
MKTRLTILLLTIITIPTVGQYKQLTNDSDTVYLFNYHAKILKQVGLETIDKIDSKYCFRFWDGISVIELRNTDNKLNGTITFMVQQYRTRKEGKIYYKKSNLSEETTSKIQGLINNLNLIELPTDEQIPNWKKGLDGLIFITEHCDNSNFSFKSYWSPRSFEDKVPEAKTFLKFLDGLNEIEELNTLSKKFWDRQPFTNYHNFIGSATIITKTN